MRGQPPSRLALFCEQIIEGCWLAALVATPLFFNVYSERIFEPDKTALLRSIVLVTGLAWTLRGIELWALRRDARPLLPEQPSGSSLRSLLGRLSAIPLLPLVLLLLADYILATSVSVAPRVSVWGSYVRLQGLYTTAAYIGIFLSILALLRTRDQLERLITAAVLASVPVSLYGIIQFFGTDPLPWGKDVTVRVASTMGNPVFVAGYLILVTPLSIYRLLESGIATATSERIGTIRALLVGGLLSLAFQMASWVAGPIAGTASALITTATWISVAILLRKPLIPFLRISGYTVVLSAQLMCIVFSQSRGPWLGLCVGLFVFALLWTLVRGRRRHTLFVMGSGLAAALLVIVINLPGTPRDLARDVPFLGRMARLSNPAAGSARVRVLIWEGVTDLLAENPTRTVVGYGPETLQLLYPRHYRPGLGQHHGRKTSVDRAHNDTFDALVTTGLIGLVVYLLFFTSLFYYGLRWVGIIRTRVQRNAFFWLWFSGGSSGVLLVLLLDGSLRFAGLSLPVGMIAGLLAYLCGYGLFVRSEPDEEPTGRSLRLTGVTLIAAVVAHFLALQFGLAIVATQTYFWSFAALLGVLALLQNQGGSFPEPLPHPPAAERRTTTPLVTAGLLVGLVLITVLSDLLVPGSLQSAATILWLFAFTWGLAGVIVVGETWPGYLYVRGLRKLSCWIGTLAGATLIPAALFAAVHTGIQRGGSNLGALPSIYIGAVLLSIGCFGWTLFRDRVSPERPLARRLSPVYVLLAVGAFSAAWITNINVVRADVYFKLASQLFAQARYDEAIGYARRALNLQPKQDVYYLGLGRILVQKAEQSEDPDALLQEAAGALLTAQELAPLKAGHLANLARLYNTWGLRSQDPSAGTQRLSRALAFSDQATALSPNTAHFWNDKGTICASRGDSSEALRIYEHSLSIDDGFHETYLLIGNLHFARREWADAARAYEEVIRLKPDLPLTHATLEFVRAQMER